MIGKCLIQQNTLWEWMWGRREIKHSLQWFHPWETGQVYIQGSCCQSAGPWGRSEVWTGWVFCESQLAQAANGPPWGFSICSPPSMWSSALGRWPKRPGFHLVVPPSGLSQSKAYFGLCLRLPSPMAHQIKWVECSPCPTGCGFLMPQAVKNTEEGHWPKPETFIQMQSPQRLL